MSDSNSSTTHTHTQELKKSVRATVAYFCMLLLSSMGLGCVIGIGIITNNWEPLVPAIFTLMGAGSLWLLLLSTNVRKVILCCTYLTK